MKKLVIFVNGNYFSAIVKNEEKLAAIIHDLEHGIGDRVSFTGEDADTLFSAKRSMIDGHYVAKYTEPKPHRDQVGEKLLKMLEKFTGSGDEWRDQV